MAVKEVPGGFVPVEGRDEYSIQLSTNIGLTDDNDSGFEPPVKGGDRASPDTTSNDNDNTRNRGRGKKNCIFKPYIVLLFGNQTFLKSILCYSFVSLNCLKQKFDQLALNLRRLS